MKLEHSRRDFIRILGLGGGVVFASSLSGRRLRPDGTSPDEDFYFLQLTDTHWGFKDPAVNPESATTLKRVVRAVQQTTPKPDFVVFTGDLTHTTDDDDQRRERMREFQEIVGGLKDLDLKFLPGEHDAALDRGEAYQELFGPLRGSFDHKGIHFLMLDNVSDPNAIVGDDQLSWVRSDLGRVDEEMPVVVFAHRPLFDLYPSWDWSTRDGAKVLDALASHEYVTVFYGHIHQENHHTTGRIEHHSARSLMFPLPAPGSVPKRAPVPWNGSRPFEGIGYRRVAPRASNAASRIVELEVPRS